MSIAEVTYLLFCFLIISLSILNIESKADNCQLSSFSKPDDCIICSSGFKHENSNCEKKPDLNQNCTCPQKDCSNGYTFILCDCLCNGFIDPESNYCCDSYARLNCKNKADYKYMKEINKCGCNECADGYMKLGYECKKPNETNKDCFYLDKTINDFKKIPEGICIKNFPSMRMVYNENCLFGDRIDNFLDINSNLNKYLIFSQRYDGSSAYTYEGKFQRIDDLKKFNCDKYQEKNIQAYYFMSADCNMKTDESLFQEKNEDKSSLKNFVLNIRNLEINYQKDTGELNLLNDFTDIFLNSCKKAFSFRDNEELKRLCVDAPNSFIDLKNQVCLEEDFCKSENFNELLYSKYIDRLKTVLTLKINATDLLDISDVNFYKIPNGTNCANCIDRGAFYDKLKGDCFYGIFPSEKDRNFIQIVFLVLTFFGYFGAAIFFGYYLLNYFKAKKETEIDKKIQIEYNKEIHMQWITTCLSVSDFIMDIGFFLAAMYARKLYFYLYVGLILLLPVVYLIIGTVLYTKNAYSFAKHKWFQNRSDGICVKSLLLIMVCYFLYITIFAFICCLNLFGNHENIVEVNRLLKICLSDDYNSSDTIVARNNRRKLKLYLKIAEFFCETILEIILKFKVILASKRQNLFEIISVTVSVISLLWTILMFFIELVENSQKENGGDNGNGNENRNNEGRVRDSEENKDLKCQI